MNRVCEDFRTSLFSYNAHFIRTREAPPVTAIANMVTSQLKQTTNTNHKEMCGGVYQ